VALALLALSRVEFGYVLLVALFLSGVWLLASRRSPTARRSTVAMAVALLLCTPWLIYTYSVTSKPFYGPSTFRVG
jgi:4-amino-4-deoxy-L-arabinose transferase-like glycosyltransferase